MADTLGRTCWRALALPVGLLVVLILYSILGAVMFKAIEGPHETSEKYNVQEMRLDIINEMWNQSATFKNKKLFAKMMTGELRKYEAQLHSAFAAGINSDSDEVVWDFWGSMVYAATIYTTIGYGHMAPATNAGRIATMVYATIGIPLCLIVLAEFGKLFTVILKALYSFPRRMIKNCKAGDAGDYAVDEEFNLPIAVAVAVSVVYMVAGAAMYSCWEDWDYMDGFYFIFISISTVGFGDLLPDDPKIFMLSFAYQLFGLALVGMVINVIMEALQIQLNNVGNNVVQTGRSVGVDFYPPLESEVKAKAE